MYACSLANATHFQSHVKHKCANTFFIVAYCSGSHPSNDCLFSHLYRQLLVVIQTRQLSIIMAESICYHASSAIVFQSHKMIDCHLPFVWGFLEVCSFVANLFLLCCDRLCLKKVVYVSQAFIF